MALMQRRHYEYIADEIAPLIAWPSQIQEMADRLANTNPNFNKEKFVERALTNWEKANPMGEFDDEIPY